MTHVLVSHPHAAAVSVEVAAAFARSGRHIDFYTGVAFHDAGPTGGIGEALARRRPVLRNRILKGLPPGSLHPLHLVELGARGAAGLLQTAGLSLATYDALFAVHDAAVAALPWSATVDSLYVYEDAAWLTFHRGARRGLRRILDVASLHHATVEAIWRREAERWPGAALDGPHREPGWKRRRKDAEIALATTISVASASTRRSLETAGIQTPIVVTPYGFPSEKFLARAGPPNGKLKVLVVGNLNLLKGTAYVLEAWRRAELGDAELHLIGRMQLSKPFLDRYAGLFHHHPPMPRRDLANWYSSADLVVFATLGDGFGLVMQEAMCSGTPVLTTTSGGGPECISDGVDGWIVPPAELEPLVDRLRAAARDRDQLRAMGFAARRRAEQWSWLEAGDALIRSLEL